MIQRLLLMGMIIIVTANLTLSPKAYHEFWFNMYSPKVAGNSSRWYYCNLKCLYLENYAHHTDFVVITFTNPLRDTFSACYVKTQTGYILWNKVISNKFYEQYCGHDTQNWLKSPLFTVKSIVGEGKIQ